VALDPVGSLRRDDSDPVIVMSASHERATSRSDWRPAAAARRPVLLINPRSGNGRATRAALAEHAREQGIETVVVTPEQSLAELVGEAVEGGADALGMAGGDGSLAVVATAALTHALPFVCIPAGTRNHFALDVGVDRRDVVGALGAFADGVERRIDVGMVNGRLFLNNVSLGVYADAVRHPAYRDAKLRTLLETANAGLTSPGELPSLRVVDHRGEGHPQPAVVLVSNNPYALQPPPVAGTRPRLDAGQLGIVVVDMPSGGRNPPMTAWTAPTFEVHAAAPVHVGIDGEAVDLDPLLRFETRPAALRVRISSRHPGVSPSGRLAARGNRGRRGRAD
jgi:diacylglycerol kinase family enzyme